MKKIIILMAAGSISLIACNKADSSKSIQQADYSEMHEDLVDDNVKDSAKADSIKDISIIPPQDNVKLENQ